MNTRIGGKLFQNIPSRVAELQTFRTQNLSFARTKGPYGELSFSGTFVPRSLSFRDVEKSVYGNKKTRMLAINVSIPNLTVACLEQF